jgi:serine/threonine protein kinase
VIDGGARGAGSPVGRFDLDRLDGDTWRRLSSILDEVLDLSPEEVPGALDRLCGGESPIREQILAILATDAKAEGYLTRTARRAMLEDAARGVEGEFATLEGRLFGPWKLGREIGRGGMGVVYLGERADGAFEQRVAIKVLGRDVGDSDRLARFRQERQILARLEHPNIARLVDGGVTDDGFWWFAMEHVVGSPITSWCEARKLEPTRVIELFQQACHAVQYAHRNLVIHRDLKPGNILVSEAGVVKLLDFGIAKILDPDGTRLPGTEPVTAAAMTPPYAAPEQIRGEPPTTATDVYALGVVLYELLTGSSPYRRTTGTLEEMRRAILEEEPEAPSRRLQRDRSPGHRIGWARVLGRDLDSITLAAMRKEPEQRYASVEALSDDLDRRRGGRPVRATGRRFGYVASKFVRRNRVPVTLAALAFLALLAGLYSTSRERDRARVEAAKAMELKEFALSLFRVSIPGEGHGSNVTARQLVDRGAERVERELRGNPTVQAEMFDLLGSVYKSLDLFPQAIAMYGKSVSLRRRNGAPDTLLAASLRELGSSTYESGDYARGEPPLREALALERRRFGEVHQRVALVLGELAVLKQRSGAMAEAESLSRAVLRVDSLTDGPQSPSTAIDLGNLGMLLYYDSRYKEAIPYVVRSLEIRQRTLGRGHLLTADAIDQVANCLAEVGELDSSITLGREALAIRRRWLAPDNPDIAHSLDNIAMHLALVGKLAEAERDQREALAIQSKSLDPGDPVLAQGYNDLAVTLYREGQLDSAGTHFREALRVWAKSLPPTHNNVLTCRNNLGVVYRETGHYAESERTLRAVLAERLRTLRPDHLDVAATQYHLGRLYVMSSRPREAEPLLRRAIEIRGGALGEDDPRVAEVKLALGNGLVAMGRNTEGRALIHESLEIAETRLGPKDRMVRLARSWKTPPRRARPL